MNEVKQESMFFNFKVLNRVNKPQATLLSMESLWKGWIVLRCIYFIQLFIISSYPCTGPFLSQEVETSSPLRSCPTSLIILLLLLPTPPVYLKRLIHTMYSLPSLLAFGKPVQFGTLHPQGKVITHSNISKFTKHF